MRLDDRLDQARRNLDVVDPMPPDLESLRKRANRPATSTWVAAGAASLIVVALVAVGGRLLSDSSGEVSVATNESTTTEGDGPKLLLSSAEVPSAGGTLAMLLVDVPAFTTHDKPIEVVRLDAESGGEEPLGWLITSIQAYSNEASALSPTPPNITLEMYGQTSGGSSKPLFVALPPLAEGTYELRLGMSDSATGPDSGRSPHVAARFSVVDGATLPDVTDAQHDLRCSPALLTPPDSVECRVVARMGTNAMDDLDLDDLQVELQTWHDGAWQGVWRGLALPSDVSPEVVGFWVDIPDELSPGLTRLVLEEAPEHNALIWLRSSSSSPTDVDGEQTGDSADLPALEPVPEGTGVSLGTEWVWPAADGPYDDLVSADAVAHRFATDVLGIADPVVTPDPDAPPIGPTWVDVALSDGVAVRMLAVPGPRNRWALVQVGHGGGISLHGDAYRIPVVGSTGASQGEVHVRTQSGMWSIELGPDEIAAGAVTVPEWPYAKVIVLRAPNGDVIHADGGHSGTPPLGVD